MTDMLIYHMDLPTYNCDCNPDAAKPDLYQCSCTTQTRYPEQRCSCSGRQGQYRCSCGDPDSSAAAGGGSRAGPAAAGGAGSGGFPSKQCLQAMKHNEQLLNMLQRVNGQTPAAHSLDTVK